MAERETEGSDTYEKLRTKYLDLALKYQNLVVRLDRRAAHDLVIYRLGAWGLEATSAALAVVEDGVLVVTNARFATVGRAVIGPLVAVEPASGVRYPDLRALAIAEAGRLLAARSAARELRFRDESGPAVLCVRLERSRNGRAPSVMILAENITDQSRRDDELKRTREALLHRERLRVLGDLAASIAHDLGNTLRGASFQLSVVEQAPMGEKERAVALRGIANRIDIASSVISRLHEFARTGTLGVAAVRLDRIIREAIALVDTDLREGKPVEVRVSIADLPLVHGAPAELSLMFVNLLRNARDAMPEGGVITVAAKELDRHAVVQIADQGAGLSPAAQEHLFEPFFSTKGAQGTGLGLWLAAGTMARLGGRIEGANGPRGGAVFTVSFPLEPVSLPRRRPAAKRRAGATRARGALASRKTRRAPRIGRQT
jgi:signal transduction histidine kinase